MLHELFITHCTNGTSVMNPFTLIRFMLSPVLINKEQSISQWYGNMLPYT